MASQEDHKNGAGPSIDAGFGHNRSHISPEELAAELSALEAAEAKTSEQGVGAPDLTNYVYEVRFYPGASVIRGDLQAFDIRHARRVLKLILGVTRLPIDVNILEKGIVERELQEQIAIRIRNGDFKKSPKKMTKKESEAI